MARPLTDDELARVHAELFAGRTIQAIKIYRNATGQGLKEAKDAVEAIQSELKTTHPEQFQPRGKGGCLTMIALLALPAAALAALAWR